MAALSELIPPRTTGPVTIAIASGKGGVGKTSLVVNVAVALARQRQRVAILDADFGLGNVDVLLGLTPAANVGHVLVGDMDMKDILVRGPFGVQVIPASSGLRALTSLTARQWQRLSNGLADISRDLDFLLIDTAAGISDNVVDLLVASERILLVTSMDPGAVVDAYALVKVLAEAAPDKEVGIVVNGAHGAEEADLVFRQLETAVSKFLGRRLRYFGFIEWDPAVRDAVLEQRAIVEGSPQSPASRCFRMLATRLAGIHPTGGPGLRLTRPGLGARQQPSEVEVTRCA
jgi:flagellar biosynthesis protein FlhG